MKENKKLNTLLEILNYSTDLLEKENVSDARLNVELMLTDVLKCDRVKLYMDFDKPLSKEEISSFKVFLKRRLNKEPLQYVLGKTNFYGYDLVVNKNVLIPRPETEILVERVLEDINSSKKKSVKIFEIGTGSGCISIALSKELGKIGIEHHIKAIDNSKEAIEVAKENKKLNSVEEERIELSTKDLFSINSIDGKYDYIISNPPYVSREEYNKLDDEIKNFEPKNSLSDDEDGFKYFKKIFSLLNDYKYKSKVFCEIGYHHKDELESMLKEMGFENFSFFEDYNKIYRILKINL